MVLGNRFRFSVSIISYFFTRNNSPGDGFELSYFTGKEEREILPFGDRQDVTSGQTTRRYFKTPLSPVNLSEVMNY